MGTSSFKVARLSDSQLNAALHDLGASYPGLSVSVQAFEMHLGHTTFPGTPAPFWTSLVEKNQDLIEGLTGQPVAGVSFNYIRGANQSPKSPVLDEIRLTVNAPDNEDQLKAASVVRGLFEPIRLPGVLPIEEVSREQQAIYEATLSRLQSLQEELYVQTLEVRRELDEEARAKEAEREGKLKEHIERADREIEKRSGALDARAAELEERKLSLDHSDNTHARRKIRDRMLADVSSRIEKFGVSEATAAKRKPVQHAMFAMSMAFALTAVWTIGDLTMAHTTKLRIVEQIAAQPDAPSAPATAASGPSLKALKEGLALLEEDRVSNIATWLRFALASLGLFGTLLFYTRWADRWAVQHAQSEFQLQQFHLDVNRANWIIESCLEWHKETQQAIPEPLLKSITEGLFTPSETPAPVLHPADQLASALMGTASKVSLDVGGGNKVEIDRPGKIPKSV